MDDLILEEIANEIKEKHNCNILSIRYIELLRLCVMAKIQFNDDFHYQPEWLKNYSISTICFSEKSIIIIKRVDLFDCVKKNCHLN